MVGAVGHFVRVQGPRAATFSPLVGDVFTHGVRPPLPKFIFKLIYFPTYPTPRQGFGPSWFFVQNDLQEDPKKSMLEGSQASKGTDDALAPQWRKDERPEGVTQPGLERHLHTCQRKQGDVERGYY